MESFIRTYKLPHSVCDKFVRIFHHNKHHAVSGLALGTKGEILDEGPKKSTDLRIPIGQLEEIIPFWNCFMNSISSYNTDALGGDDSVMKSIEFYEACNIQYYEPKQGFFSKHFENFPTSRFPISQRLLVWMLYLTDTPNAGTCFPKQNYITECTKGDLIIWPAGFTHPHYGIISDEHEKMILTGWVHRCIPSNMDVIDETMRRLCSES